MYHLAVLMAAGRWARLGEQGGDMAEGSAVMVGGVAPAAVQGRLATGGPPAGVQGDYGAPRRGEGAGSTGGRGQVRERRNDGRAGHQCTLNVKITDWCKKASVSEVVTVFWGGGGIVHEAPVTAP